MKTKVMRKKNNIAKLIILAILVIIIAVIILRTMARYQSTGETIRKN